MSVGLLQIYANGDVGLYKVTDWRRHLRNIGAVDRVITWTH